MTWFDFWLAFLVAVAIIVVPGYLLTAPLGLSRGSRLVFAPITSAAAVAVLGVGYGVIGLHFTPLSFAAGVVVIAALALGARWLWLARFLPPTDPAWSRREWIALAGGLVVAGGSWLFQFVHHLTSPNAVGKIYDTAWHLSIIRHIIDSGNASTLKSGIVDPTVGSYFYPASWHSVVALVERASPADVPTAVNATILAVMAVAWPLSLVALTRIILRRDAAVVFVTVALSAAFGAYPTGFLTYGPLYSNLWGFALLPALLAALVLLFRAEFPALTRGLLFAVAVVGAAVAQPNAIFTAGLLAFPVVVGVVYRWQSARDRVRGLASAGAVVLLAAVVWVGIEHTSFMARTVNVGWGFPNAPLTRAVGFVVSAGSTGPAILLGVLVLAGLIVAWFKARWLVGAYALAAALYVVGAAFFFAHHYPTLRKYVTGFWYHDPPRMAAILVVVELPLAVLAIICGGQLAAKFLAGRGWKAPTAVITAGIAVVALAAAMLGTTVTKHEREMRAMSVMPTAADSFDTIDATKVDFMRAARAIVGDAGVANDPFDGSSYGYGMVDLNVFYKSLPGNWMGKPSRDQKLIRGGLNHLSSPGVCGALKGHGITYAIQLEKTGTDVNGHPYPRGLVTERGQWKGLNLTPTTPGFQMVLEGPEGRLYKITGC